MANFEVIALNPATPQLRAPGAGDGYSMPRSLSMNYGTITTDIVPLTITQSFNNAGVDFHGIVVNQSNAGGSGGNTSAFQCIFDGTLRTQIGLGGIYTNGVYDVSGISGTALFSLDPGGLVLGSALKRILSQTSWYLGVDNNGGAGRGFQATTLRTPPTTVGALTAGAFALQGARSFVTDATLTIIAGLGTVAAGGGANAVPVYYNGANWIIG